jgi:hypothetical protein
MFSLTAGGLEIQPKTIVTLGDYGTYQNRFAFRSLSRGIPLYNAAGKYLSVLVCSSVEEGMRYLSRNGFVPVSDEEEEEIL